MTKKTKIAVLFTIVLIGGVLVFNFASADTCPTNTQAQETQATLVGQVTDDGGDPNLTVWFQYGKTTSYGLETSHFSKYGVGAFCAAIYSLEPCAAYHYRAIAQNSAGISYGENKSFTTKCLPLNIDLKANSSDGPITLKYKNYVTLSWTSANADSCAASGDWSGSKSISSSETIQLNQVKTYTFTLTCKKTSTGQTTTDSVQVIVQPNPPVVITIPAVVTW